MFCELLYNVRRTEAYTSAKRAVFSYFTNNLNIRKTVCIVVR